MREAVKIRVDDAAVAVIGGGVGAGDGKEAASLFLRCHRFSWLGRKSAAAPILKLSTLWIFKPLSAASVATLTLLTSGETRMEVEERYTRSRREIRLSPWSCLASAERVSAPQRASGSRGWQ